MYTFGKELYCFLWSLLLYIIKTCKSEARGCLSISIVSLLHFWVNPHTHQVVTSFGLGVLKGQTAKDKISYFQETPLRSSYFGENKTIFVKDKTTKTEEWLMCDFFRHAIWLFKSPCQRNQYKHGLQLAHFIAIFERSIS